LHTVRLRKICPVTIKGEDGSTLLANRALFPEGTPTQTIANVLDVFDRMYFSLSEVITAQVLKWTYCDIFDEMALHYAIDAAPADEAVPASAAVNSKIWVDAVVKQVSYIVGVANARTVPKSLPYHAFISYHTEDLPVLEQIMDNISPRNSLNVYSDEYCLSRGDNYLDRAIEGIKNATVFIPIVSTRAIEPMLNHDANVFDRVVAEWICALLLWHIPSCRLRSILPLINVSSTGDQEDAVFQVRSRVSNEKPSATRRAVLEAFERLEIAVEPKLKSKVCTWTVHEILNRIIENMGMVYDGHFTVNLSKNFLGHLRDVLACLPDDRFINAATTSSRSATLADNEFKCNTVSLDIMGNANDKVVKARFLAATNAYVNCFVKHALSPAESKYIEDEIKILKTLNIEPITQATCVTYFGSGINYVSGAEYKYFVMEDFGTDLSTILDGNFPKLMAYSLALKVVDCVRSVHSIEIMHGDLKPKNILHLFDGKDFRVKLCDFDSARKFGELFPLAFKCTPAYMCPELCTDSGYYKKPADFWASAEPDLFSLGLILWQLLSGGSRTSLIENRDLRQLFREGSSKTLSTVLVWVK
jgi:hypothetical protein